MKAFICESLRVPNCNLFGNYCIWGRSICLRRGDGVNHDRFLLLFTCSPSGTHNKEGKWSTTHTLMFLLFLVEWRACLVCDWFLVNVSIDWQCCRKSIATRVAWMVSHVQENSAVKCRRIGKKCKVAECVLLCNCLTFYRRTSNFSVGKFGS